MTHLIFRTLIALGLLGCTSLGAGAQTLDLDTEISASATVGCAETVRPPAPTSRRADSGLTVLPPSRGIYLGAYQIPAWHSEAERFRDTLGVSPPIVFSFHDFFAESNGSTRPDKTFSDAMEGDNNLPPLQVASRLSNGNTVLALAWAVYCCDIESTAFWFRLKKPHDHINRLLAGQHDDFIRQTARQIRDWGGPIMLTIVPEMNWQGQFLFGANGRSWIDGVDNICNAYGDPTWPDGPERIRDLNMRVIDIFRAEGAHNVTWFMYSANQYMAPGVEGQSRWLHPKYYYPGDAYMDWVGQSVYFTDPAWNHGFEDTGSFEAVFRPGYDAWRSVTQRPMILPEFGLVGRQGDDGSAVWADLLQRRLRAMPGVAAVTIADSELFALYFNIPRISAARPERDVVRRAIAADSFYRPELRIGTQVR
jgi:hypothetical protein